MSAKKRKGKDERPVFDSIRKPTAPPSRKMDDDRPEEKTHPAGRKLKYRPKDTDEN